MTASATDARVSRAADFERVACEAAQKAGALLREGFQHGEPLLAERKGLHDFVTRMDREAEDVIRAHLLDRFPDHAIMAEEGSPDAKSGPGTLRWIVDPLDGTTNFIHGVPIFGVSVAVEDASGIVAGAIHDPVRGETFHAHRGGGAWLDGRAIRCSRPSGPGEALVATGFPFRELARLDRYLHAFEAFVRSTAGLRRAGAATLDLAWTACGRYDGFWEIGLSRWDVAAGVLLIEEAGGTVTDVLGGPSYLDTGDVVAAGSELHPALLAVTRNAFG
jgi:myo-inositol-1(or 4)-monophosphatase